MQRRRLLAGLGTGLAVGLAGCGDDVDDGNGAGDGGENGAGENGDGENGGDPDETPFADADWRDGDGLDVEALAEAHVTTIAEAGGFTLFSTADSTWEGEGSPSGWLPSQEYESSFELERERYYLRQELTESDETERSELYLADGEAFIREQFGDQVSYDRQEADLSGEAYRETMEAEASTGVYVPRQDEDGEVFHQGLTQWNLADAGAGEVNGERTARFTADEFDGERDVPREVESAAATVDVAESGLVPLIQQTWAGTHEEEAASVDIDLHYRDVGQTTVDEPDWVAEARDETDGE